MRDEAEPPVKGLPPGIAILNGDYPDDSYIRAFATEVAANGGALIVTNLTGQKEVGDEGLPTKVIVYPIVQSPN